MCTVLYTELEAEYHQQLGIGDSASQSTALCCIHRHHQVLSTTSQCGCLFISCSLTVNVVAKFSQSRICDKIPEGSTLIFGDTLISIKHSVAWVEENLYAKSQLDPCSHFNTIPACDRHTQTDTQQLLIHALAKCHAGKSCLKEGPHHISSQIPL